LRVCEIIKFTVVLTFFPFLRIICSIYLSVCSCVCVKCFRQLLTKMISKLWSLRVDCLSTKRAAYFFDQLPKSSRIKLGLGRYISSMRNHIGLSANITKKAVFPKKKKKKRYWILEEPGNGFNPRIQPLPRAK
jgi:hypothetical protein